MIEAVKITTPASAGRGERAMNKMKAISIIGKNNNTVSTMFPVVSTPEQLLVSFEQHFKAVNSLICRSTSGNVEIRTQMLKAVNLCNKNGCNSVLKTDIKGKFLAHKLRYKNKVLSWDFESLYPVNDLSRFVEDMLNTIGSVNKSH
ncbi:MAG: hypothetical protein M0R74_11260 [Dehalococcoidia bacterium]|nr:hypothetical protein [Dehalococcoidia bacterium]